MLRAVILAIVCACCTALQPSQLVVSSARTVGRAAAPAMKRPDYFVRVARSEAGRPRLCVFRSNKHIYAQVIDDSKGLVLASASSMEKEADNGGNCKGYVLASASSMEKEADN